MADKILNKFHFKHFNPKEIPCFYLNFSRQYFVISRDEIEVVVCMCQGHNVLTVEV